MASINSRTQELVFMGLCSRIGISKQLAMRRDVLDMRELIENQTKRYDPRKTQVILYTSGSHREGFRLQGSDRDFIYWLSDHTVIWGLDQVKNYSPVQGTLILAETDDCPPGFSLLKMVTPTNFNQVASSFVKIKGDIFISSFTFRDVFCSAVMPNSSVHGPCGSGKFGPIEYDYAHCFSCDFWPPSASSWIDRCSIWPPPEIVHEIARKGCHFVPIGHKRSKFEELQWRISFSLAEQKLVYTMNHCQFLTYGLLKMFLKEVINTNEEEKLLCSYHMKTAVFWVIQQGTIATWSPQNFLHCFWACFKAILKWVYFGVCPSFFIPENNLFTNIHGCAQTNLFRKLYGLFEKGVESLLDCPSLNSFLQNALKNRGKSPCTDESTIISEVDFDILFFKEIFEIASLGKCDLRKCLRYLSSVEDLVSSHLSEYHLLCLENILSVSLQNIPFLFHNKYKDGSNKIWYIIDRISHYMVKLTSRIGFMSNTLLEAMYCYKTFRYKEALALLDKVKVKLSCPYLMYCLYVNDEKYIHALFDHTLTMKMRKAVTWNVKLYNSITYVEELSLEQKASRQENLSTINVPPFVMLLFLKFLCVWQTKASNFQKVLTEFHILLESDNSIHVPSCLKDISWQMLGICYEMSGNFKTALHCYSKSIQQQPLNKIQEASLNRARKIIPQVDGIEDT
ncbi:uncharacterized protein LOC134277194 [Saccostrea cucullata]|uniref:uncharacterized protein LOC134277194 n=1 Tax=Saccostrea cuccullata TaxID=36930 RepID=UPI002ED41BB9